MAGDPGNPPGLINPCNASYERALKAQPRKAENGPNMQERCGAYLPPNASE